MKTTIRSLSLIIFTLIVNSFVLGQDTTLTVTSDGKVGIGTSSPSAALDIVPDANKNLLEFSTDRPWVFKGNGSGISSTLSLQPTIPDKNFDIRAQNGSVIARFFCAHTHNYTPKVLFFPSIGNGRVGIGTGNPTETLDVAGTTKCKILKITGGSDLAEPFDIKENNIIKAGMVLAIDADSPGKLKIAEKAYDRCVAGIVSGAGGIKPGMIMSQMGSVGDGEFPVALTGRVYCLADAANGSINPGDLLTTSSIPGHAMKVTDYSRAQGAIIGKAMSSLAEAQGLVLVLVTLQ